MGLTSVACALHTCIRRRQSAGRVLVAARQCDDGEPKIFDRSDNGEKFFEIDRLGYVTVRMQLVGAQNILLGIRGRQHDDWNIEVDPNRETAGAVL
jgi:hypothetical protein